MTNTLPIVYLYPGARWQGNSSRQHLLTEALSRYTPVVLLSTADYARSPFSIKAPYPEHVATNYIVLHDALSLRANRWWRRLGPVAARVDGYLIHRALRRLGITDYVFWLSTASPDLLTGMRLDRLVYDCIDPNFDTDGQAAFDAKERQVTERAALVFCTAETLLRRMRTMHPNAHLLNNAASPELHEAEQISGSEIPEALRDRPRPIVGYLGTVDWRVDCDTITAAARELTDFTFCVAGRVNADQEARVTELRSLPNVVMPGALSADEGATYTNAFDVAMIPYLPGDVGDAINPVKMYMHLLSGVPVVTTWINECRRLQPLVAATRTPAEFIDALRDAAEETDPTARQARVDFARRNTWDDRAAEAVDLLREAGLLAT